MRTLILSICVILLSACQTSKESITNIESAYFTWDNATIYFLMTDRFYDGDESNNYQHHADNPPAPYRGYMGGDLKGITKKIEEGYFTDLGVNAIWMTPVVEQIEGSVDEGTGNSFGFHGYWTRDWTALDSKFGTRVDLKELVKTAHQNNIRILIDVVANHTGPVTSLDSQWPDNWVKTGPQCQYTNAESTINCTLVANLPDIKTESDEEVELPPFLIEKWKAEGRYEIEVQELEQWFGKTGYKRTAVNHILKWLVDFIKEYGVDGFRVDTVKHTEDFVWNDLWKQASAIWEDYKDEHPEEVIDDAPFYMVGEVYNYYISEGRDYNYGDRKVDFFDHGFHSLINFDFKSDAKNSYEDIFSKYNSLLQGEMKGKSVVNYISSHDDGSPFDKNRNRAMEAGTKLLLCPGATQIYYGDETARSLSVEAEGDAVLRSFMNWDELENQISKGDYTTSEILAHWQKLGKFRRDNPAVGAGTHKMISAEPYLFSRSYQDGDYKNNVVVGLDLPVGMKIIPVRDFFKNGETIVDGYSGKSCVVKDGKAMIDSELAIVLLGRE